jgi:hypothetical protein
MRKTLIAVGFLAASSLMAFGGPAAAQGFGQVPIAAAPPEAPAPGGKDVTGVTVTGKKPTATDFSSKEVVCHSEAVIGSLFPKKVCATKGELALRRQNDQEVARRFENGLRDGQGNTH